MSADNWAAPFVLIFFKCFPQSPCKIYCSLTIVKSARRFSSSQSSHNSNFRPKNNTRKKNVKNLESTVKIRQVFRFVHACPQEFSNSRVHFHLQSICGSGIETLSARNILSYLSLKRLPIEMRLKCRNLLIGAKRKVQKNKGRITVLVMKILFL